MLTEQKQYLTCFQLTADLICLGFTYCLFLPLFAFTSFDLFSLNLLGNTLVGQGISKSIPFMANAFFFVSIPCVVMKIIGGYKNAGQGSLLSQFIWTLLLDMIALFTIALLLSGLVPEWKQLVLFSLACAAILLPLLILNRLYIHWLLKNDYSTHAVVKHCIVTNTGDHAQAFTRYILDHPETGLRITGFLTEKVTETQTHFQGRKVIGHVNDLMKIVHTCYTDCVVLPGIWHNPLHMEELIKNCSIMGLDVVLMDQGIDLGSVPYDRLMHEQVGDFHLVLVKFVYRNPYICFFKRVFDFSAASALIIACLPIWGVIGYAIHTTSKGPVFFRQTRLGKYGRRFTLFKFRSMYEGAEKMQETLQHLNEMDGPAFKIKNDPRLTRVGIFLRKTSLDELPQLFNVFLGDISLVGPRPAIESEVAQYRPAERKRMAVVQGITCIWQISGRNEIQFDEWMKLDQLYIEHWSSAQDFKILFRTVPAVLLKKGAY